MKFYKSQLMTWSGNKISDHNRSALDISTDRIENRKRMADATSRSYVIADKKSFSLSWTDLPGTSFYTVDNNWGAKEMENFYKNAGVFTLNVIDGQNVNSSYLVYISSFDISLTRRVSPYDLYDVSVEMVEV